MQIDQPGRVTCDAKKLLECGVVCAIGTMMSRGSMAEDQIRTPGISRPLKLGAKPSK